MFEEQALTNPPLENGDTNVEEGVAIENPRLEDDLSSQVDTASVESIGGGEFIENPPNEVEANVSDEEEIPENPPL